MRRKVHVCLDQGFYNKLKLILKQKISSGKTVLSLKKKTKTNLKKYIWLKKLVRINENEHKFISVVVFLQTG